MKKSDLIVCLAALAAAAFAVPASAQFFVGLGAGQSRVSNSSYGGTYNGNAFTLSGLDSDEMTLQFNGGYQFTPMWGLQVQYTDLGSRSGTISALGASAPTGDVKAYQWGVAGTGTFFMTPKVFLRGKLGVSSNHIDDINTVVGGRAFSISGSSNTDVLAGIGVGYEWSKNFSTRLEYEYFGKFDSNNGSASGTGTNLGLRMQYTF